MKKVVLLGDSIRLIGYGPILKDYLPDDVTIWQSQDNCRFAKYTLRMLFENHADIAGADVIHWNNGLWDATRLLDEENCALFTPIEEYVTNMSRIADILLKMGKKVIFSTTTPCKEYYKYTKNKDIREYNAAIVPVLKAKGIIINDLYPLIASDIDNNIRNDDEIHLTEKGAKIAAESVSKVIKEYL